MTVITSVLDGIDLVPHFLRYYRKIGGTRFIFNVWNGKKNPLWDRLKEYPGAELYEGSRAPRKDYNGAIESKVVDDIILNDGDIDHRDWVCIVDLDEFLEVKDLDEVVAHATLKEAEGVHGVFIDRVTMDYSFPSINREDKLDDLFPMVSDISYIVGANPNKVCIVRASQAIKPGHHQIEGAIIEGAPVHHFKWRNGLHERLKERARFYAEQKLPWHGESLRILRVLNEKTYLEDPIYNPRLAPRLGI